LRKRKTVSFDEDNYAMIENLRARMLIQGVSISFTKAVNSLCRVNSLGQFVKVHRDEWVIAEYKRCFLQHPSGNRVSLFVAVNMNSRKIMLGIDVADLESDIDEAMR